MQATYCEEGVDMSLVRYYISHFKDGEVRQTDLSHKPQNRRSVTASNQLYQDHFEEVIHRNCQSNKMTLPLD